MSRSIHQKLVDAFMRMAGQQVPDSPTIPDEKTRFLRAKLILEEALETIEGLGFEVYQNHNSAIVIHPERSHEPNLVEVVDGCCDLRVVTTGTLSACGVQDYEVQMAVDNNNLEKFGPGHRIREDGKLIKPPGHKPPDIAGVLARQDPKDE